MKKDKEEQFISTFKETEEVLKDVKSLKLNKKNDDHLIEEEINSLAKEADKIKSILQKLKDNSINNK